VTYIDPALKSAEERILGKKFCTGCQKMQDATGGSMTGGRYRRWVCGPCETRKRTGEVASIYSRRR
jgi:hypothetical protein